MNKNKNRGYFDLMGVSLWNLFASLKLSVFLFSSITIGSIIGTFLPDRMGFIRFIQGKPAIVAKIIDFFQLTDVYSSWWFILLIILLGVNIICCSIERLPGVFKIVMKKPFPPSPPRIESLEKTKRESMDIGYEETISIIEKFFNKKGLGFFSNENDETFTCVGEKGRWTRLGVYITHLGFLLLILGGLIGSFRGFTGTMEIIENQEESVVNLIKNKGKMDLGFSVFCESFKIKRYKNGSPKSFESSLIFKKNQEKLFKDIVKVNKPVKFNGIKFIQSGYGRSVDGSVKLGLYRVSDNVEIKEFDLKEGDSVIFPDGKTEFTLFAFRPNFQISSLNLGESFIGVVSRDGKQKAVALPVKRPGFDRHRKDDTYLSVKDFKTKAYTSLQVSKDPGVYVVYMGFLLLLLGCFISFFMVHKSFYILVRKINAGKTEIIFAFNTNKKKEIIEVETEKFAAGALAFLENRKDSINE